MTFSKSLTNTTCNDSRLSHRIRRPWSTSEWALRGYANTLCVYTYHKSFLRDAVAAWSRFFFEFRSIITQQADRTMGRGNFTFFFSSNRLSDIFFQRKSEEFGRRRLLPQLLLHDGRSIAILAHCPTLYACHKAISGQVFKNVVCTIWI